MSAELKNRSLYDELVTGKGYQIIQIENMQVLDELRKSFVEKINLYLKVDNNIQSIRKKLASLSKAEINKAMIKLLSFTNLSEIISFGLPDLIIFPL